MAFTTVDRSIPRIEPPWVSVLPSTRGLWNMINTFRERGSHDTADTLEAAAEKQAEVHLKVQQVMMGNNNTGVEIEQPEDRSVTRRNSFKASKSTTFPITITQSGEYDPVSNEENMKSSKVDNMRISKCISISMTTNGDSDWEGEADIDEFSLHRSLGCPGASARLSSSSSSDGSQSPSTEGQGKVVGLGSKWKPANSVQLNWN